MGKSYIGGYIKCYLHQMHVLDTWMKNITARIANLVFPVAKHRQCMLETGWVGDPKFFLSA